MCPSLELPSMSSDSKEATDRPSANTNVPPPLSIKKKKKRSNWQEVMVTTPSELPKKDSSQKAERAEGIFPIVCVERLAGL